MRSEGLWGCAGERVRASKRIAVVKKKRKERGGHTVSTVAQVLCYRLRCCGTGARGCV